ncbi:hypothetical protein K435DRAFT_655926, partial [Dendrothele bispora CBS 962.96]
YLVPSIQNCGPGHFFSSTVYVIQNDAIALLFLLRVRAIFHGDPRAQTLFVLLWFLVLGSSTLDFLFVHAAKSSVEPDRCTTGHLQPVYSLVSIGMQLMFDTIVYIAISYRLFRISMFGADDEPISRKARFFFNGATLPKFSRSLFRDGQLYYLQVISLLTGSTVFLMLILPSVQGQNKTFVMPPQTVLTNIIACWVFRNVKLGRIRESEISLSTVSISGMVFEQGERECLPARSFMELNNEI